jgi:hypothetical protein
MEWVSYLAGELHSDQPECVSPVRSMGRGAIGPRAAELAHDGFFESSTRACASRAFVRRC